MTDAAKDAIAAYLEVFRALYGSLIDAPELTYSHGWVTMRHQRTTRRMRLIELRMLTKRGAAMLDNSDPLAP